MSKYNSFIFKLSLILALIASKPVSCIAMPEQLQSRLTEGNSFFEDQKYTEAAEKYEQVFKAGHFTEKMLYRMAFINENLRNYPAAIFYLKKIQKEYGGTYIAEKIIQLMQKNGSSRYMTEDQWGWFYLFMKRSGAVFWSLFILSVAWLIYFVLFNKEEVQGWKSYLTRTAVLLCVVSFCTLCLSLFISPNRAVIVGETAFYTFPSYGAKSFRNVISQGETVDIRAEEDIWFEVESGGGKYWVPKRTVRKL